MQAELARTNMHSYAGEILALQCACGGGETMHMHDLLTPPGTPVSIEEREEEIRKNRKTGQ